MPNSIGPICAIYPSKRTESGAIPVYIHIPQYMPSVETPWVVSVEPCAPVGLDEIIVLPLLGTRSVHSLIHIDHTMCIFELAETPPPTGGLTPPSSTVYIQIPCSWTYGVHEQAKALEVPSGPTGVRHHIRKMRSWIETLRKGATATSVGSEVCEMLSI